MLDWTTAMDSQNKCFKLKSKLLCYFFIKAYNCL